MLHTYLSSFMARRPDLQVHEAFVNCRSLTDEVPSHARFSNAQGSSLVNLLMDAYARRWTSLSAWWIALVLGCAVERHSSPDSGVVKKPAAAAAAAAAGANSQLQPLIQLSESEKIPRRIRCGASRPAAGLFYYYAESLLAGLVGINQRLQDVIIHWMRRHLIYLINYWVHFLAYEPLGIHHGIGVISKKNQIKLDRTSEGMDKSEMRQEINSLCDSKITAADGIWPASIIGNGSQCDGVICKEGNWGRSPMDLAEPLDINHGMKNLVKFDQTTAIILKKSKLTNDVYEDKVITEDVCPADGTHGVWTASILEGSSHHDGAIYKKNWGYWRPGSRIDLADRTETVLDLKKFSEASPCFPDQECCLDHPAHEMIQIISLRLAKTPISSGLMLLYGYLAARDRMDGKLNYIFNRSRDNPVIIQQGDLIEMTGPRRGIVLITDFMIESDMRIKIGERQEDDLQLIDGLTCLTGRLPMGPSTLRFNGSCGGAVDMRLTHIEQGMEALIEVIISEVQSAFSLSLVSTTDELEEIHLFHGAIAELGTKRFVVAVEDDAMMHLKFKVGKKGSEDDVEHCCSFNSNVHGCVGQQLKLEVACILVKVTVSPPIP